MNRGIVIKKSKIHGRGVFAARDFKEGEVVLHWKPKKVYAVQLARLSQDQKKYLAKSGKQYLLMQPPEKYVNFSHEANTLMGENCDIAKRYIKKGEEITSDYKDGMFADFKCNCGSKKCKVKKK